MKKRKKSFEEMMKPFCLVRPRDEIGARKCGRECCGNCRTCVYHRPHRKDRLGRLKEKQQFLIANARKEDKEKRAERDLP